MILASHQPDFFPWMGYFYKIYRSDCFVFSDNVQFSKTGRHNYNSILTANGVMRFTIPVHQHVQNLNEIQIAVEPNTIARMLKTLEQEYRKAKHYDESMEVIEKLLISSIEADSLASFNHKCILDIAERFGLTEGRRFLMSSDLPLTKRRDERIIEMCKLLGADTYISGDGAKDYHVEQDYVNNGIKLVYSDYQPIVYEQVGKPPSINMSVIDYVMNCGFKLPWGEQT